MSDTSDLEYAADCDQQAVYALTDLCAEQTDKIAELEAERDALIKDGERLEWQTLLPANLDECMEIAVPLRVGWFRCIGYVAQDLSITDYDGSDVGYTWGGGNECYWRPISDDPYSRDRTAMRLDNEPDGDDDV